MKKNNLKPGVHSLKIISAEWQEDGRLKIQHEHPDGSYKPVRWTMGPDKQAFLNYMETVLEKSTRNPTNAELRTMLDAVIEAEISEGSTGWVNLKRVVRVISRPGLILNMSQPVNDGFAAQGGKDPKEGGHGA